MPNEDFDILIYIPFEEKDLNEKEINWINTFEKILNVGLKQITKQKISLSKSFINEGKISGNSKGIIQLIIKNTDAADNLLHKDIESSKIIQVVCQPDINISEQFTIVNLFDETSAKSIDLTDQISELKNEIWLKFLDIAYEIRDNLIVDKGGKESKGKIYVAETSSDQNFNRETIVRELEHIGYEILPEANFPKDMLQFSEMVSGNLKECFLSIHLIGNYYAPLLNNIDISSIELQNDIFHEVAAELAGQNKMIKRLVWIPPNIKPKSEKQRLYIESFKRNIELLKNTEIIQTPIEIFKNIIRQKAVDVLETSKSEKKVQADNNNKSVYLISNDTTGANYKSIKQYLQKSKLHILETTDKTSKIDLIQEHYYNLVNCDALLIDYSIENNQWLSSKFSDILKSPGFGRKKEFLAKTVLVNTGSSPQVNLNISNLDLIIDNKKDTAQKIESFIEKIK